MAYKWLKRAAEWVIGQIKENHKKSQKITKNHKKLVERKGKLVNYHKF